MPSSLQLAIGKERRPSPADRRQMIRIIVDELRKSEANPTRSQCKVIAHNIIQQYPKSFADYLDDGKTMMGTGYESLLTQLKVRVEHVNRGNTLAKRRAPKCGNESPTPKRGPVDSYGCLQWQPEIPPEETEAGMEEKRLRMAELHSEFGSAAADKAEVDYLLKSTYYLQRRMINAEPAPAIKDLRAQWPLLFVQKSLYSHFELLTGVPTRKMEQAVEERGRLIVNYFRTKPTNDVVKKVLGTHGEEEVAALVVELLMAHFKEKTEDLILKAQVPIAF